MKHSEFLARLLIGAGLLLVVGAPLLLWNRTPLIHARVAENGGWNPDVLQAEAGKPLHLKMTSDDVVHGFAVGRMDMEPIDIEPGQVTNITLTFDKPGTYTFYCTRWCGPNHWRMRGTIEVSGPAAQPEPVPVTPLYVALGLDLDRPHEATVIPVGRPSAVRGERLATGDTRSAAGNPDFYRANSPYQLFQALAATGLSNSETWDVVAYVWQSNTTSEALANGEKLYTQNCAACHGESGAGDGVFADDLARAGEASLQNMAGTPEMARQRPANFRDPRRMLGASPALLQGKILRGGMGTGMPTWGSIFTEKQIWDLIAYIYSFQFEYHN